MTADTADTELRQRANGKPPSSPSSHPEFKSPLDKRYHLERSALLGRGQTISLAGFMNLLFCLTTLAATGLLLENFNKYGLRVALSQWVHAFDARQNVPGYYPAVYLFLYMPVQIFVALGIEKAIAAGSVSEAAGLRAHLANLAVHLAYPVVGIWRAGDSISVLGGVIVCQLNAIVFLKLWSFVQTCWWARDKRRRLSQQPQGSGSGAAQSNGISNGSSNGAGVNGRSDHILAAGRPRDVVPGSTTEYPDNLTIGNLAYFTFAPTLCYELDYPRNASVNWRRVMIRGPWLVFVSLLNFSMIQQWLIPSYLSVLGLIARGEWFAVAERVCKIAIPNNMVWLVFFYQMFHVNMILVGELSRFADRRSYDSWWDSEDTNVFWRRWNMPVHHWCVRHLYTPFLRLGYSRNFAKWATFVVSGLFHEYLVSPPLRMFRVYAFLGMLVQVPLGNASEWVCKRLGPRWGNAVVWFSICLGQPLCAMLYLRDYLLAGGDTSLMS